MNELIEALRDLMSHSHNGFPQEKKDVINEFIARMDAFPHSSNPCKDYSDFENRYWDSIQPSYRSSEWSKYCSNFIKAVTGEEK